MMPTLTHAKLTKLATLPNATVAPWGGRDLGPINDGYEVKGHYWVAPEVGSTFTIGRYESNGVKVEGFFRTSTVTEVTPGDGGVITFRTLNSTYQLTPL